MRKITLQKEKGNTFFVEYKINGGIVTYGGNTQEIKKVLDEDIGKNKYILTYGRWTRLYWRFSLDNFFFNFSIHNNKRINMKKLYKKLKEKGIVNNKIKLGELNSLLKKVGVEKERKL